jgi:hypothetical protein
MSTVKAHRQHAMDKANWQSVVPLVHWALATGIAENEYLKSRQ